MLRQNMNAISQQLANCRPPSCLTKRLNRSPITATRPPTTMRRVGRLRHLDKSSGGSFASLGCALILLFQIDALTLRDVINGPKMAQLQRAQIGDDGPAVLDRYIWTIRAHRASSMGNDVKDFAIGVLHVFRLLQVLHRGHHVEFFRNAVAVSFAAMAGRAVNVETLLAAMEQLWCDGKGIGFNVVGCARDKTGEHR